MNVQELNEYLFQYTDSEKKHRMTGPAVLSQRYQAISRIGRYTSFPSINC